MAGVFIKKGMTVGIPTGGLTISVDDQGKISANCNLHVHFDVCPTWLELASRHLADANEKKVARMAAWQSTDETAKAESLEREFEASMQAIMAAAIAMDAFYAVIKTKADISETLIKKWKDNGTARYAQISEVLRQAFTLKESEGDVLRQNLKQIFKLRDLAVHPDGQIQAPLHHPEINVAVEWRFFYFRAENASILVGEAQNMIRTLVTQGKPKNAAVQAYADALRTRLQG